MFGKSNDGFFLQGNQKYSRDAQMPQPAKKSTDAKVSEPTPMDVEPPEPLPKTKEPKKDVKKKVEPPVAEKAPEPLKDNEAKEKPAAPAPKSAPKAKPKLGPEKEPAPKAE